MNLKERYTADNKRYDNAETMYARCGRSGILLPRISLGFWQNFGHTTPYARSREIAHYAFDNGITHFDLANNYGPPYGTAEETLGQMMKDDFKPYRDELFISTKAGYDMWPGPYGNWGSRKYLFASLDQSLKRMNLEYVDLFYIHRYDPVTPLEETLQALVDIVRSGKALYVGISRWPLEALKTANEYLKRRDVPPLIFQGRLNLLDRAVQQEGILDYCDSNGIGFISFSPLAQGLLTDRYMNGVPEGSRMSRQGTLTESRLTPPTMQFLKKLGNIAARRGEPMAATALSWVLSQRGVTSVLTGVSSVEQLKQSIKCINNIKFTDEETAELQEAPTQE